jgi:hypothetical protein
MKRARSVEWYEDCLVNNRSSVERLHQELERLQERVKRAEEELAFRELQIQEAKRLKKTEFDSESFLKSKRPKGD